MNDMSRELLVIRSWRGCTDADKRERSVAYGGESEISAGQTGCRFASFLHSRVRCPHPGVYPTEILNSAHPIYMGGVTWSYLAPGPEPAPNLRASEIYEIERVRRFVTRLVPDRTCALSSMGILGNRSTVATRCSPILPSPIIHLANRVDTVKHHDQHGEDQGGEVRCCFATSFFLTLPRSRGGEGEDPAYPTGGEQSMSPRRNERRSVALQR